MIFKNHEICSGKEIICKSICFTTASEVLGAFRVVTVRDSMAIGATGVKGANGVKL